MALFNCVGWIIYSIIIKDYFIFFSNIFGLVVEMYFVINSLVLLSLKHQPHEIKYESLEKIILAGTFFWGFIGMIIGITINDTSTIRIIVACSANLFTVIFYIAPIKAILHVIATKDSSSINWIISLSVLINSALWFIYGLIALNDPFVYAPNFFGIFQTITQFILLFVYPSKSEKNANTSTSNTNSPNNQNHESPIIDSHTSTALKDEVQIANGNKL
jgi:solute carrier family 50 protein (sugar transporter)